MRKVLAALAVLITFVVVPRADGPLKMTGTWELVREKSSPRPAKLCDPGKRAAGLKGDSCYPAMPQIVVEETADRFTVAGATCCTPIELRFRASQSIQ